MKLTKQKLNQLIRESLADYDGYGSPSDDDLEYLNTLPPKTSEKDLFASLSKEEKDLAEEMLYWWSQQIKKGRESTLTGKDPEPFYRMWQDWDTVDLGIGDEEDLKLVRDALINWPFWGGSGDRLIPETKALASKIKAILDGDEPEEQEEQTPQEIEQDRWRKSLREPGKVSKERDPEPSSRFANLEFDEALQRYKEGQTMKLTRSKLHQLIREELNKVKEADSPWGPPHVEPHPRDAVPIEDPVETEPEEIPIEDITFDQLRGKQVTMADSGGMGGDSSVLMSSEPRFEEWKSTVLRDYPGSTIIFNRWGRWSPGSGPWKDAAVKKQNWKAKEMARWGSH